MTPAIQRLANALNDLGEYDSIPEDTAPVMLDSREHGSFFELVVPDELNRQLTFADLMAIVLEAKGGAVASNEAHLTQLRAIRLWHWLECLRWRKQANEDRAKETLPAHRTADQCDTAANMHLGFVQSLNDFFPDIGDTAERDAEQASQ